MTTLRRKLTQSLDELMCERILSMEFFPEFNGSISTRENIKTMAEVLADAIIELRVFKTDEERPPYDVSKAGVEWAVYAGTEIKQKYIDENVLAKNACDEFERALHFNPLDWELNKDWQTLKKFVVAQYRKNSNVYKDYASWREGKGQYKGALNNKNILDKPLRFISLFPDFLASNAIYGKPKQTQKVETDASGSPKSY